VVVEALAAGNGETSAGAEAVVVVVAVVRENEMTIIATLKILMRIRLLDWLRRPAWPLRTEKPLRRNSRRHWMARSETHGTDHTIGAQIKARLALQIF
jgi:hypothetical protein